MTTYTGLPGIAYKSENGDASGIRASLIADAHFGGTYRGIIVGGIVAGSIEKDEAYRGQHENGGHLEGLCLTGLVSSVGGELRGASISGIFNETYKLNGVQASLCENQADTNGIFSVQIGAFNKIKEYQPKGIVLQIGLWNRAGTQISPLINIRGIKFKKGGITK